MTAEPGEVAAYVFGAIFLAAAVAFLVMMALTADKANECANDGPQPCAAPNSATDVVLMVVPAAMNKLQNKIKAGKSGSGGSSGSSTAAAGASPPRPLAAQAARAAQAAKADNGGRPPADGFQDAAGGATARMLGGAGTMPGAGAPGVMDLASFMAAAKSGSGSMPADGTRPSLTPYDAIMHGLPTPMNVPGNNLAARTGMDAAVVLSSLSQEWARTPCALGGGQMASAADIAAMSAAQRGEGKATPLAPVIDPGNPNSPYMEYLAPTTMQPFAAVDEPWSDSTKLLEFLDPKGAAALEAALKLTATPGAFFATEAEAAARLATERAKQIRMRGKLDLTPEEVLSTGPAWVPTARAIARATLGDTVDRTIATNFPIRFTYPDMLEGSRPQTARPVLGPGTVLQEPMSPGMDAYVTSTTCGVCKDRNPTMQPL